MNENKSQKKIYFVKTCTFDECLFCIVPVRNKVWITLFTHVIYPLLGIQSIG